MTYTPKMFATTQLEIIRVFGCKDLSEWCLIQQWEYLMKIWCIYEGIFNMKEINSANCMQKKESDLWEILWHIPHLEDVYRVAKEKWVTIYADNHTNALWIYSKTIEEAIQYDLYTPLLEQSESTLIELLQKFNS